MLSSFIFTEMTTTIISALICSCLYLWCLNAGMYQTLQNSSRFSAPVRNRVVDGHLKTSRQNREETTNSVPADFTGTFKENEIINRDLGKPGMKGNGRRGGPGRAELSRTAGRSGAGHWVVVNDKQRELDGEREPGYVSNLHGLSASLEKGVSSPVDTNTGSSYSSPQAAKLTSNSGKEDSPNGSGGKSKEDSKRRRGQIQEWRMKQPSPPHAKPLEAASGTGLVSQQDAYPEGILPLASQVWVFLSSRYCILSIIHNVYVIFANNSIMILLTGNFLV